MRPRLEPVLKLMNSSIVGGPSGVPEAHSEKDGFCNKMSFHLHRTHAYVADFFVGVHRWNAEGAASRLFRGGARQG